MAERKDEPRGGSRADGPLLAPAQEDGAEKCADCGKEIARIKYIRRATIYEAQQMRAGRNVKRDTLCEPCWKKQDHD